MSTLTAETQFAGECRGDNRLPGALRQKQQIVSRLIEGRLCLTEAAAGFRAATNAAGSSGAAGILNPLPSDGESICRTVIGWVHLALADRPEQADAVSARLESELQAQLDRFGSVRLPSSA